MILVDTSVWINHLRDGNKHLEEQLIDGNVMCHPHIIGELACGNIKNRKEIISLLRNFSISEGKCLKITFFNYISTLSSAKYLFFH
ncbi:MAG: hypothetical protein KKF46_08410 [Nanoarchaeota archaeon]|nr:hypothetical protein [Nanoarchaeota archaeon]MBU1598333.1 hypothetical protein [Nanoarchaeota archaeon]